LTKQRFSGQWTRTKKFFCGEEGENIFFDEEKMWEFCPPAFPAFLPVLSSCPLVVFSKCFFGFHAFELRKNVVVMVGQMRLKKYFNSVTEGNYFFNKRVKELTAALKIAILDGVFEFLDKLGNHHF
jgi:hypothetical protein